MWLPRNRGVPFRIEIGPRDVDSGQVVIKSRLGGKEFLPIGLIRPRLAGWLNRSVKAGHLSEVEFRYQGYAILTLERERAQCDWYFVPDVRTRQRGESGNSSR